MRWVEVLGEDERESNPAMTSRFQVLNGQPKRSQMITTENAVKHEKRWRTDTGSFYLLMGVFFFIPIAMSPPAILGGLFLAISLLSWGLVQSRGFWLHQAWTKPVLLFMVLPWIGLLWTADPVVGLRLAEKTHYGLYSFAVASMVPSVCSVPTLLSAFLVGLAVSAFLSLVRFFGRVPIVHIHHIAYSLLLVFGMLIVSFRLSKTRDKKEKWMLFFLLALFSLAVAFGKSRAGYLALMMLSPLMLHLVLKPRNMMKVGAMSIFVIGLLFLSPVVRQRVILIATEIGTYESQPNTSIGLRFHMWSGAVRIFLEHPLLGTGTGGIARAMEKYERPRLTGIAFTQPHNSFLYMAASFGLLGLISISWLFFVVLRKGWRARDSEAGFSIFVFVLVLLIGGLTDSQILSVQTGMLFSLLTGFPTEVAPLPTEVAGAKSTLSHSA